MIRRPIVSVAAGFAIGAAFPAGAPVLPVAAAGVLLSLSPPLAMAGFACAGWASATAARVSVTSLGREQRLDGEIASVPDRLESRVRFVLRTREGSLVQVNAPSLPWPLAYGDAVRLVGRVRPPERARNPGGRDRAAEFEARGIDADVLATSPPVRIAAPAALAWIEAARDRFAERAAASLPEREAGLVRAIGTGDRGGVDTATADAFARSGLAHRLPVSGRHRAVVALGSHRALRWILARSDAIARRADPRRLAAAVCIPLSALYALSTGAQVPVVRSAVATTIGFGAILLDREVDALTALALAALAILALDPGALLDVSFQLSFASVAGLALCAGPLRRAIPIALRRDGLPGRVGEALLTALCASVAATVTTAPLVALHFRRLSLVGVLANLVGVPLGSLLTIGAALSAVVTAAAPPIGPVLIAATAPLASALLWVNDLAASAPHASVGVGSPGWVGVAVFYVALVGAWRLRHRWRIPAAIVAMLALLGPPHLRHALAVRRGGLEVTFLSVGQGDSTALLLPDGSLVLVDGGGEATGHYDPGARDVVPWLRDAGITRIAAVFLSHPHPDHLLGLPAVAAAFPVEHLFTNGRPGDAAAGPAFARLPSPERFVAGSVFERAGVRIEALAPSGDHPEWTENDASLVLRVSHGAARVLLCGDVEAEGEAALLADPAARLGADIVKIPHHGSSTSSTAALVAATHPAVAIASVGHLNRFGFPDPAVVQRWESGGARVLRTDEGAIRFLSDGRAIHERPARAALDALALARERL